MRAGRLDRRVEIRRRLVAGDPYGGETASWETVATVWAGMRVLRASEINAAQGEHTRETREYTIRYRPGLAAGMAVVDGGHEYRVILPPRELGRRAGLVLTCEEVE